jgi:lysozyme
MQQNGLVIDISHWNEVTDWHAVRASGVLGVIHKFSQGVSYRDDMFNAARAGCEEAGLLFGRYHFAEGSDVMAQVRNFLADYRDGELLALDWEDNDGSTGTMSLSQAVQFVEEVHALTGQMPVLYSGNTAKEALGSPNTALMKCRLWLAHYADDPVCPPGWDEPWLWQWTDEGKTPGIAGNVDQDAWAGSESALRAEWCGREAISFPERPERPHRPSEPPHYQFDTVSITVPGSIAGGVLSIQIPAGARVVISTTGRTRDIDIIGM